MEFVTPYSTEEEIADAMKGVYGKQIDKDVKILYLGNAIIGIGELEQIKKRVECKTSNWMQLAETVFLSYLED